MGTVLNLRVLERHRQTEFYESALWSCSLCPAFDVKGVIMAKHLEER